MDPEFREKLRTEFQSGYFLERSKAIMRGLSPLDAPPSWLDEELREALDAIEEPHERKKRTTILRLAEALANGMAKQDVFDSPDCVNEANWHGRHKPFRKIGWKEQPTIAHAYELALKKAHAFYDSMEEQRLAMRRYVLADTQDRLTEISGAAVEVLLDIMLDPESASDVRRKAAVDALTHASVETAPKSQADQAINLRMDNSGPTMSDIRNRQRRLPARVVGGEGGPDGPTQIPLPVFEEGAPPPPSSGGLKIPRTDLYTSNRADPYGRSSPPPETPGNGDGLEDTDQEEPEAE